LNAQLAAAMSGAGAAAAATGSKKKGAKKQGGSGALLEVAKELLCSLQEQTGTGAAAAAASPACAANAFLALGGLAAALPPDPTLAPIAVGAFDALLTEVTAAEDAAKSGSASVSGDERRTAAAAMALATACHGVHHTATATARIAEAVAALRRLLKTAKAQSLPQVREASTVAIGSAATAAARAEVAGGGGGGTTAVLCVECLLQELLECIEDDGEQGQSVTKLVASLFTASEGNDAAVVPRGELSAARLLKGSEGGAGLDGTLMALAMACPALSLSGELTSLQQLVEVLELLLRGRGAGEREGALLAAASPLAAASVECYRAGVLSSDRLGSVVDAIALSGAMTLTGTAEAGAAGTGVGGSEHALLSLPHLLATVCPLGYVPPVGLVARLMVHLEALTSLDDAKAGKIGCLQRAAVLGLCNLVGAGVTSSAVAATPGASPVLALAVASETNLTKPVDDAEASSSTPSNSTELVQLVSAQALSMLQTSSAQPSKAFAAWAVGALATMRQTHTGTMGMGLGGGGTSGDGAMAVSGVGGSDGWASVTKKLTKESMVRQLLEVWKDWPWAAPTEAQARGGLTKLAPLLAVVQVLLPCRLPSVGYAPMLRPIIQACSGNADTEEAENEGATAVALCIDFAAVHMRPTQEPALAQLLASLTAPPRFASLPLQVQLHLLRPQLLRLLGTALPAARFRQLFLDLLPHVGTSTGTSSGSMRLQLAILRGLEGCLSSSSRHDNSTAMGAEQLPKVGTLAEETRLQLSELLVHRFYPALTTRFRLLPNGTSCPFVVPADAAAASVTATPPTADEGGVRAPAAPAAAAGSDVGQEALLVVLAQCIGSIPIATRDELLAVDAVPEEASGGGEWPQGTKAAYCRCALLWSWVQTLSGSRRRVVASAADVAWHWQSLRVCRQWCIGPAPLPDDPSAAVLMLSARRQMLPILAHAVTHAIHAASFTDGAAESTTDCVHGFGPVPSPTSEVREWLVDTLDSLLVPAHPHPELGVELIALHSLEWGTPHDALVFGTLARATATTGAGGGESAIELAVGCLPYSLPRLLKCWGAGFVEGKRMEEAVMERLWKGLALSSVQQQEEDEEGGNGGVGARTKALLQPLMCGLVAQGVRSGGVTEEQAIALLAR
jgi:hypothetical protein